MRLLEGLRVAVLATDGVEHRSLTEPARALGQSGAKVYVVALHAGRIQSYDGDALADTLPVDVIAEMAHAEDFDALLIPAGRRSIEALRHKPELADFLAGMLELGRPIAALGDGLCLLGLARAALPPSDRMLGNLERFLAQLGDESGHEVLTAGGLVAGQLLTDLEPFCLAMVDCFATAARAERGVTPTPAM